MQSLGQNFQLPLKKKICFGSFAVKSMCYSAHLHHRTDSCAQAQARKVAANEIIKSNKPITFFSQCFPTLPRHAGPPACPGVSVCFLHHQQSFFSLLSLVFPHICCLCFHRLWLQARINRDKGPIPCYGKWLYVPARNVLLTASHLHFNSVNSDFFFSVPEHSDTLSLSLVTGNKLNFN